MRCPNRVALALLALAVLSTSIGPAFGQSTTQPERSEEPLMRIGFVADAQENGEREPLRAALAHLRAQGADWLLYGGDTSYGYGEAPDDWLDALGDYGEQERVLFVYGNHDKGESYRPFMPGNESWWSWSSNNVTIVGIDTNRPLHDDSWQLAWLRATLDEHRDDFVVLVMHISWWAPNLHHSADLDFPGDADTLDALVEDADVELVLGAHEHYYARWQEGSPTRLVNGAVDAQTRSVPEEVRAQAASHTSDRTWMLLEVHADELRATTYRRDAEVFDSFAIARDLPPAPTPPAPEPVERTATGNASRPALEDVARLQADQDLAAPQAADAASSSEAAPPAASPVGPLPPWATLAIALPLALGLMLNVRRGGLGLSFLWPRRPRR